MRRLALLIVCALFWVSLPAGARDDIPLRLKGQIFHVALADTPETLARGLMGVKSLPKNKGMLFLFNENRKVVFWMKNTPLSLDLLFLSRAGRIVQMETLKAHSLTHTRSYRSVWAALELPSGTIQRLNLQIGDRVLCEALDAPNP